MNLTRVLIGGLAFSAAGACAAVAQDAPAAPPPKPDVKIVEDWQVRCYPVQAVAPCDMLQEQGEQSGRKILSISISYVPSMDRHAVIVSVPLDVSLAKGVVIQTDSYTSPVLKYRMCTRDGCYVQTAVDNDLVAAVAKSTGDAKVNVVGDADGKTYSIKFSLKGFAQAHDDMVAQAKAKATKAAPAGAAPAQH